MGRSDGNGKRMDCFTRVTQDKKIRNWISRGWNENINRRNKRRHPFSFNEIIEDFEREWKARHPHEEENPV